MGNRLFGFDTRDMNIQLPKMESLEAEIKSTFGIQGFQSSVLFSQTLESTKK